MAVLACLGHYGHLQLPDPIAHTTTLGKPWRQFQHALNDRIKQAAIAA